MKFIEVVKVKTAYPIVFKKTFLEEHLQDAKELCAKYNEFNIDSDTKFELFFSEKWHQDAAIERGKLKPIVVPTKK